MRKCLLLLFAIAIATADLACPDTKVYAKITKVTKSWATEESFKILSGKNVIYTSPSLVDNQERVIEVCLDPASSNTYTLQMNDSADDSWSDGAWISIQGINGNIALKQMMGAPTTESYNFALYSPINKGSTWKYTANPVGSWKDVTYADTEWTNIETGSTSQSATGTQYFRHAFAGASGMSAVEFQLNYRYGIIAYINGIEVFRDNMPDGEATSTTVATGSYTAVSYHGVIRTASVVAANDCVLAVEVHFLSTTYSEIIQFNGFLAIYANFNANSRCFNLPLDPAVTHSGFTNAAAAFSWTRNTGAYTTTAGSYITLDYSLLPARPEINGFRMWAYTNTEGVVSSFDVGVSNSIAGPFSEIFTTSGVTMSSESWSQWRRIAPMGAFNYVRLTAYAAQASQMYFYEYQFQVCNNPVPGLISYKVPQNSYYRYYENVEVVPQVYGFSNCQITPELPAGLVWNTATCSVSGVSQAIGSTTYTVSTVIDGVTVTGTFKLTFVDCNGSFYKIQRTYKTDPQHEYFRIYDSSNNNIIYQVQQGHKHTGNEDWVHYLCITQERFDVMIYSTTTFWTKDSYIYMYYVLPSGEEEMIMRNRFDNYENTVNNQYLRRPAVDHSQQWYYKYDSVPANWHSTETAGWSQAARGTFPTATNKIQLYKKSFTVSNINDVKGYVLSIRYKYGCVVYLNGHEAWRNGVSGDVTASPVAENVYTDLKYRVVTLPGKTFPTAEQPTPINYLQQGVNTIAIALVAVADTQTATDFDCYVRLMASEMSESRLYDMTVTVQNVSGAAINCFTLYYGTANWYASSAPCTTNSFVITLNNDRREWVSSAMMQSYYTWYYAYDDATQFDLYARNGSEEWTLLKQVTDLSFSLRGQRTQVYFQNNKAYNQFKFQNVFPADHATQCSWRIQSLDLLADNNMVDPEPLVYPETNEIFQNIEMSEIIPTGGKHFDFSVSPALPAGVKLDPQTGWVSGTATATSPATIYTVTATKFTGGTVTATFSLTVSVCSGERSMMTVRFRADANNQENSWKLFQGRGTSGAVIRQVNTFPYTSNYYYIDFCLDSDIYTFQGRDSWGDGWQVNTGYTLTVDVGAMELDVMELDASASGTTPVTTTSTFSTYFPFQMEYSEWKVNQSGFVEGWNAIAFDDSTWQNKKAAEITNTEQVTTYIRKTFDLVNVADYQVLNIRMKYSGGIACYFNGNLVGRFNMEEDFEPTTESLEVHDPTIDAKFHIVLPTAGVVEGTNVIAFEVHRPKGASSMEPVVFDATGVFGVEDCSTVIDSFSELTSTTPTAGTLENIMDLDPYTTGTLPNAIDTYIEWTVDNLVGSKWNTFNLYTAGAMTTWGFTMYAYLEDPNAEPITVFERNGITVTGRSRNNFSAPVSLAGFRKYKWEVYDASASNYAINSFFMNYCKASGAVCPAIDNYPSVGEGQISPSVCPEGFSGYSYRECANGELGEVKLDMCTMKLPTHAQYSKARFQFIKGIPATTGVPTAKNIVNRWYIDEGVYLPEGMTLNEQTGEISGTPTDVLSTTTFTVYAENDSGAAAAIVTLQVRKGQCPAEGVFPLTNVGEVAVYECSMKGAYVGTQQRACVLGAADGEWQKATGFCMSIAAIVGIVLVVIAIIIAITFVAMRSIRKAKSIGGVKSSKKSNKSSTKTLKKQSSKAVKV